MRTQHPSKEIEHVIRYAESIGWRYKNTGNSAHAWGRLLCHHEDRDGCILSVWSTPKNALNHARQILRTIKRCPHKEAKHYETI